MICYVLSFLKLYFLIIIITNYLSTSKNIKDLITATFQPLL